MAITRRKFLNMLPKAAVAGLLAAAGSYGGYQYGTRLETKWLDLERVQVPLKNLKPALEGFTIVQLSDLHLRPYTQIDLIDEAVSLANSLKPDVVAITGDFVLRDVDAIFELAPVLAKLNPKYGIFTALGNHDLWTDSQVVRTGLTQERIPVLQNEGRTIGVGRELINIAGVDDGWSGRPDLQAALDGLPAGIPTILLAHEPDLVDSFSLDGRVSLQLSGHSHGGQIRLPGFGALILPYLGQKYDQGLHRVNDTWVYTNRGLGVLWPPIRLNCRPEVTEITLTRH